jgi:RNA polymerase sigma-70 factor (ECF subfamily)
MHEPDTEELVRRAGAGDQLAVALLLYRHRHRLRKMVAVRMDARLVSRLDPSDVVQETLVEAVKKLQLYLRDRPLPFYAWLRQIAWNRLVDLHRQHVLAEQRTVAREEPLAPLLSGRSARHLTDQLLAREKHPAAAIVRQELINRMREAIDRLPASQREVLILRHLEDLSVAEVAAILNTTSAAVTSRHFRALSGLRELMDRESEGGRNS